MSAEDLTPQPEIQTPAPAAPDAPAPAPEPAPAEAKADGETPEAADEAAKDDRERDDKGRFKPVQSRIDELTKARREAEREAAYWRQLAQGQQPGEQQQAAPAAKPTPDQYQDYGEYVEALTDWKAKAAAAELLQQRAQQQQQEVARTTWAERQAEARQRLPDFDDVLASADAPVAKHVADVLLESPKGPDLAYHFARNPAELARINSLPPLQAALEVGRLEATLARPAASAAPVPATRQTNAPKPASVGAATGRAASLDPARMTMDEYKAYRKPQGARWAN